MKVQRGRGTSHNPHNRFENLSQDIEWNEITLNDPDSKTQIYKDSSKSIIAFNESPDIGFKASLNPYRGCEHGCVYCYARPTHEYLGFSSGLDFESKILIKENAPQLLRKQLCSKSWEPQPVVLSGNTDCYQPLEKNLEITRQCLKVFLEFQNPVVIITKNSLVLRDIDILKKMSEIKAVSVYISMTTLDEKLSRIMEPRASYPQKRLETIQMLQQNGIPVGVLVSPIIPAINEHEIPQILQQSSLAGARMASYVLLRLPYAIKDLFSSWLEQNFSDRKEKVLNHLKDMRGGKLYESAFGKRMRGQGQYADSIRQIFSLYAKKYHFNKIKHELNCADFKKIHEKNGQMNLFA